MFEVYEQTAPSYDLETDDVQVRGRSSEIDRSHVDLSTSFCGIQLKSGIITARMSCVTEPPLAIEAHQAGGLGVLHRIATVQKRAEWVEQVRQAGAPPVFAFGSREVTEDPSVLDDIISAGARVAVLDSSNAGSKWDFLAIAALCERYSPKELPGIVPGNFIYPEELELYAELLEKETRRGRDLALILNRATGSICDTGRKTTDGRPSWAATREMAYWIYHEWPWFRGELVPDGGLSGGADMGKMAIFPRVRAFMFGRLAAQVVSSAAEECPDRPGFKIYYGMGSNRAREEAARNGGRIGDRYKVLLEEGVVTLVPIVGSFHDVFDSELEALAATFIQTNCSTFDELNSHGRWTWISQAGRAKLNPHSLIPLPEKA